MNTQNLSRAAALAALAGLLGGCSRSLSPTAPPELSTVDVQTQPSQIH